MFVVILMIARIKLSGTDHRVVDETVQKIVGIAKQAGVKVRGPIPLPTKKLRVAVRYSPDGQGSETYEHWEMRIHKRIIDVAADDRVMKMILRIPIPENVKIEIKLLAEQ